MKWAHINLLHKLHKFILQMEEAKIKLEYY